ncbi:MAG: hypothetical protein EU536_00285 [Promethearchaeota archaeon]|nr:MAG: hypothetical protein EU536_00285 [Candidatus Lokiarchaeota archaeon]
MKLEYSPGTPKDLFGKKARVLVAQMTYPELVNFLLQHGSPKEAEEHLRDVGRNVCRSLLTQWAPKSRSVIGLIKELLKIIWNGKMDYKIRERTSNNYPSVVEFIDTDCKLCKSEEETLEVEELHYCAAVSGFIEALLNHMALQGVMKLPYQIAEVQTISSIGSGQKKCIHLCRFSY